MRLLIVSNRLPVTVTEKEGRLRFQQSMGGLVSGLSAWLDSFKGARTKDTEFVWVGWPGLTVDAPQKPALRQKMTADFNACPVFVSEKEMDKFYHGFCNKTLWPLFHYLPSFAVYDEDFWNHYKKVNDLFCDAVLETARPGDVVWIHDYHLMLLPQLVREKRPDLQVGFFLHTPFPSFEIFRLLPAKWRSKILHGILGADLIGFHTHDYTQYFLTCVHRILGYEHQMGEMAVDGRFVKAGTFPMGIDFDKFFEAANSLEVRAEREKIGKSLSGFKTVLSVDRLDYSKGVVHRLEGFEIFLKKYPQWRGKVVLLLVVVSSRIGIDRYQMMKEEIDRIVGRINGKWGSIGWTPVLYQYRFLPFHPLVALYTMGDVALVTPLRDGMNLIAKEYVVSRTDQTGVLVLSETAGASKELGEALIINPNNREEMAEALHEALMMPEEEQKRRNRMMQNRLRRYDVVRWAGHFLEELEEVGKLQKHFQPRRLKEESAAQILGHFQKASKKLLFFDYDGTLVPFSDDPQKASPPESLCDKIRRLASQAGVEIVVISGRDRHTLEKWLGRLPVHLVAEHGIWHRKKGESWQKISGFANDWKSKLLPILETFAERVPGSFVEEKEYSVVWHYRRSDPEQGAFHAKELMSDLVQYTANIDIQVLQGNKVVEVRPAGINKGTAGMRFMDGSDFDFVMAMGDDWTDEDLFRALPKTAYSIRVGMTESYARFHLPDHADGMFFLDRLFRSCA